jgi:hypothetical protein
VSFPGAKARPGGDAANSLPSSAEVENDWELYLLTPKHLHDVWWDRFRFYSEEISASMKLTTFWNIAPCILVEVDRLFRDAHMNQISYTEIV